MNDRDESCLNDLLDGLLDDAETRALRERLAVDPELADAWQDMRRLRHLLRQDDGLRAPPDFGARVRERIGAADARPRRRWPWVVPAAAVILLGLVLGHRSSPDGSLGARVETKELVLPTPAPSLARERSSRAKRTAEEELRTLTLIADSLDEGRARLDDLLAGQAPIVGLLPESPASKYTILGTSLRRVTREQYLRLLRTDAVGEELQPTFDVRVIIVSGNEEGTQGAR